jgi:hypothetical protein
MLFGVVYSERNPSEETQNRALRLFTNWRPPVEFKGHWAFATGGGMAIIEADTAGAVVEAIAPWIPFLTFKVEPIVPIEDGVPIFMKTNAWRDSIS